MSVSRDYAITERHNPSELTIEDLDRAAAEMERRYFHPYLEARSGRGDRPRDARWLGDESKRTTKPSSV